MTNLIILSLFISQLVTCTKCKVCYEKEPPYAAKAVVKEGSAEYEYGRMMGTDGTWWECK